MMASLYPLCLHCLSSSARNKDSHTLKWLGHNFILAQPLQLIVVELALIQRFDKADYVCDDSFVYCGFNF